MHAISTSIFTLIVSAIALLPAVSAQQSLQEKLIEKRANKLAKPFVTSSPWQLDYAKARAAAAEQGKFILAYFTRSFSG